MLCWLPRSKSLPAIFVSMNQVIAEITNVLHYIEYVLRNPVSLTNGVQQNLDNRLRPFFFTDCQ